MFSEVSFCFGWVLWHIKHYRLFNAKSSLDIYIRYMIYKQFVDKIFKWAWAHFFFSLKWFQEFLTLIIQHYLFVCTVEWFQVLLCITNNLIRQSFIYTVNGQTVLNLTIWFNVSHLFAHSLNLKQFYLTHR